MNKFRDLTKGKKKIEIITSKGIVDFTPTFEKDECVKVKDKVIKYSSDLTKLKGYILKVNYCKVADLGDMVIEVVYLSTIDNSTIIQNPYLVEHFELIK